MILSGLRVADEPALWSSLGFAVEDGVVRAGGVAIELAGREAGEGILEWHVEELASTALPAMGAPVPGDDGAHPNGVSGVDHVVAFTGDFDGAVAALAADGIEPRRIREAGGGVRQAFYVLGTALLELGGPVEGEGPLRFWGLTLVVEDLDALAAQLGDRLGSPRDAVQPGRRIATLRRDAGSSVPLAFITPR